MAIPRQERDKKDIGVAKSFLDTHDVFYGNANETV